MQQINLPVKILTQYCENLQIEAYVPPYEAKVSTSNITLKVFCEELDEKQHWKLSIEVAIANRQIENPDVSNFELMGRWSAVSFLSVTESESVTKDMLRQYIANTVGSLLFGTIRANISTAMQPFGYLQVIMPPMDSANLVGAMLSTDEEQKEIVEQAMSVLA